MIGGLLVETRIKLLGHPVHPMLIVFPLGLLSTAVLFDVVYVLTGNADLATFSYWALAAGLAGGLLAAVFGLIDWLGIPDDTRAKRIGAMHGTGNLVVWRCSARASGSGSDSPPTCRTCCRWLPACSARGSRCGPRGWAASSCTATGSPSTTTRH